MKRVVQNSSSGEADKETPCLARGMERKPSESVTSRLVMMAKMFIV